MKVIVQGVEVGTVVAGGVGMDVLIAVAEGIGEDGTVVPVDVGRVEVAVRVAVGTGPVPVGCT